MAVITSFCLVCSDIHGLLMSVPQWLVSSALDRNSCHIKDGNSISTALPLVYVGRLDKGHCGLCVEERRCACKGGKSCFHSQDCLLPCDSITSLSLSGLYDHSYPHQLCVPSVVTVPFWPPGSPILHRTSPALTPYVLCTPLLPKVPSPWVQPRTVPSQTPSSPASTSLLPRPAL